MTKEKKDLEGIVLPEPGTPEGEAFDKRLYDFKARLLEWMGKTLDQFNEKEHEEERGHLHKMAFAMLVDHGAVNLKEFIMDPNEKNVSWDSPWLDIAISVGWDWERGKMELTPPTESLPEWVFRSLLENKDPMLSNEYKPWRNWHIAKIYSFMVYSALTNRLATVFSKTGEETVIFYSQDDQKQIKNLKTWEQKAAFIDARRKPFCLNGFRDIDQNGNPYIRTILAEQKEYPDRTVPLFFDFTAQGETIQGAPVLILWPLEIDEKIKKANFRLTFGLVLVQQTGPSSVVTYFDEHGKGKTLSPQESIEPGKSITINPLERGWTHEEIESLWEGIIDVLPTQLLGKFPEETEEAVREETQRVQASYFPEYIVPRAAENNIKAMSSRRGLGAFFKDWKKVPDLSLKGDRALQEAISLFWEHLETYLDKEAPGKWGKTLREDGSTVLSLHGLQVKEAEELWRNAVRSMAVDQNGPGLKVIDPKTEQRNRFVNGEVIIQTDLHLWPDEALEKGGEPVPPVSFYLPSSRGYVALLDKQGGKPFVSDGWLIFTIGDKREKWTIDYNPMLLSPSGRKALLKREHEDLEILEMARKEITERPTLFEETRKQEQEKIKRIEAAQERQKDRIRTISIYDTDKLMGCLLEQIQKQREAWTREELVLGNGAIVSTHPLGRYIRLDPEDIRIRLDPREEAGSNWRQQLIGDKLEALARYQREIVTKTGKKVEKAERLVEHIIDGRYRLDKEEEGEGLQAVHKRIQDAGGIPSQDFFVKLSIQFMRSYFYIIEGGKDIIPGEYALQEALQNSRNKSLPKSTQNEAREEVKKHKAGISKKPYYRRSNRHLVLSGLEEWGKNKEAFFDVLLAERTDKKTRRIKRDGVSFVPCMGSYGKGYKVKTWVDKVAPGESRPGPRGGVASFKTFLEGLSFFMSHKVIGLQVELSLSQRKNKTSETYWNEEALSTLRPYRGNPREVHGFKLTPYLPEDLEKRIRARLKESHIEAMDEGENMGDILTPSTPGGLRPIDIKIARTKAGWSQGTLAEKVGVSRVMVAYWENGNKPVPFKREAALREILKDYMEPPNRLSV